MERDASRLCEAEVPAIGAAAEAADPGEIADRVVADEHGAGRMSTPADAGQERTVFEPTQRRDGLAILLQERDQGPMGRRPERPESGEVATGVRPAHRIERRLHQLGHLRLMRFGTGGIPSPALSALDEVVDLLRMSEDPGPPIPLLAGIPHRDLVEDNGRSTQVTAIGCASTGSASGAPGMVVSGTRGRVMASSGSPSVAMPGRKWGEAAWAGHRQQRGSPPHRATAPPRPRLPAPAPSWWGCHRASGFVRQWAALHPPAISRSAHRGRPGRGSCRRRCGRCGRSSRPGRSARRDAHR